MRQVSVKATKSVSHAGRTKVVNVRVSNGRTSVVRKAVLKTK